MNNRHIGFVPVWLGVYFAPLFYDKPEHIEITVWANVVTL